MTLISARKNESSKTRLKICGTKKNGKSIKKRSPPKMKKKYKISLGDDDVLREGEWGQQK